MKLSDQFKKDYRQMTAQGVKFTPEDIVLLNALSVKTRLSATAARDVHLPRLAFLPRDSWWRAPLVLREPTVAHDLWLELTERFVDTSKDEVFLFLHAFALSRHPGRLPDANRPEKVIKAVFNFAGKRLCKFTRAQLSAAVEYCLFGADWTVGARGPERDEGRGMRDEDSPGSSPPSPPSSLIPHPSSLVPHPSSLIPRPSSLIPRPSSLVPHPSSLIPDDRSPHRMPGAEAADQP